MLAAKCMHSNVVKCAAIFSHFPVKKCGILLVKQQEREYRVYKNLLREPVKRTKSS